jgi:hypothetical protein
MIGKFANACAPLLLSLAFFPGATAFAQTSPPLAPTTPATQPSSAQPSPAQQPGSDQEPAEEESTSRPKKPKDYKNWTYDAGIGATLESGTSRTFVREGGYQGTIGVARNANKYLGLRADFLAADLPLRQSSLSLAQASSASSYLLSLTLDPIINIAVTKLYGGYILFGPGYYHRAGSLSDDTAVPGSSCNPFYEWWGSCPNVSIPLNGSFTSTSLNQFGYNFGAGVTRKMPSGVEIFAEFRLNHASGDHTTTDVRPVTIGVRW